MDAADAAGAAEASEREIDARLAVVLARFGDRLDDAGRAAIRSRIAEQREQAAELRAVKLQNGDEPDSVFAPFRQDREGRR